KKVRLILESSRKPLSLETPIGEDSELGDFLEDKSAGSPNESLLNQDLTTQVERALSMLSPKEKEILRLRFGIGEEGEHTDRKSTRLNSSHQIISYAVFCLKK